MQDESFAVYTYPLPLLKELNIVDTPGTNAIIRRHERLTDEFVPRSNLVLFVTSADRPLTESERQFLERILTWGKKIVLVMNKLDIFEEEAALQEVQRLHPETRCHDPWRSAPALSCFRQTSPARALQSLIPMNVPACGALSRLDDLEQYISATLDDTTRLELKFNNPLGVAERLIDQAGESLSAPIRSPE